MDKWLIAVDSLAKTKDGSPEATSLMQEWEVTLKKREENPPGLVGRHTWRSQEEEWRRALHETGLLKQLPVTQIQNGLQATLEGVVVNRGAGGSAKNYDEEFVKVQKGIWLRWQDFFSENSEDKFRVTLVAGESGSGKTMFATHAPKTAIPGTTVLYAKLDQRDLDFFARVNRDEEDSKAVRATLSELVERKDVTSNERWHKAVAHAQALMSFDSQAKAFDIARGAWEIVAYSAELEQWWDGMGDPLPHLTMVLDDVEQLDFARELVDGGASLRAYFQEMRLAESVHIVLVGKGLERIDRTASECSVILLAE